MAISSLRDGHLGAFGQKDEDTQPPLHVTETLEACYQKHEDLRGIPAATIRKAWFTMAHLLVPPGGVVADMGCLPEMTFTMAVLNPQLHFIGLDPDRSLIKSGQKKYSRDNLEFRPDDFKAPESLKPGSLDAVLNSFNLHEIYSAQKFSDRPVINALERHFALLKQDGLMFIRDFAMMAADEFVLMEMPDIESRGEKISELSEADLLIWYAQHARPQGDRTWKGFFLEELPPRFPQTRLFRLPSKWAYEFIIRKDSRDTIEAALSKEYAFFTQSEYSKTLRGFGARVLYTAPHWDDALIRERFHGHFRLYSDEGRPLGSPPTSFIAIAQKLGEKKSLRLLERRPSQAMEGQIRITAMRNEANGRIFDVVSRDVDITEILPYRVTGDGQLSIFIHEGLPRGIANAVPRTGRSIDGKSWSGHMTEAISVPTEAVSEAEQGEPKALVLFARDYLGLKPAMAATLEAGKPFYPAPDFIDEQIKTRYLRVAEHEGAIEPRLITQDLAGFTTKGRIREVGAQSILNAISVGYIPNARLEMQILDLYEHLGLEAETWQECPLALDACEPEAMLNIRQFAADIAAKDKRYKDIKGTAGQVRMVKSLFVDEGWVEGGIEGMAARDIEFVIADDQTVNKAVILPLTRHVKTGEALAGLVTEYLPVPQRHKGNGLTLRAPSVTLPKEITSIDQAKKFIAEKFEVPIEKVARLGESYFCHLGVTPVRLFPFAVATTGQGKNPFGGPIQFAPVKQLYRLLEIVDDWNFDRFFLGKLRKTYITLGQTSEVTATWNRSSEQTYADLNKSAAAIINSSTIAGLSGSAPAATPGPGPELDGQMPVMPVDPGPGSSFITSPDFLDIRNSSGSAGGPVYSAHIHNAASRKNGKKDKKYKTK